MNVVFAFETRRKSVADVAVPGDALAIFVDYGDKNDGLVFDHHTCSDNSCSTSIVCSDEGLRRLRKGLTETTASSVCIVTHSGPDLDSVAAATAVRRFALGQETVLSPSLVRYVREKDQGEQVAETPEQSLSILFQAIKNCSGNDEETMIRGIQLVEIVDKALREEAYHIGWNDLADIPDIKAAFSSELSLIATELQMVQSCLSRSPKMLLAIPGLAENGMPSYRWTDAVIVDFSTLDHEPLGWKDFVRSDRHFTITANVCSFMAVRSRKHDRDNYIISVDPRSGLSLMGLGAHLDHLEALRSIELEQTPDAWNTHIRSVAKSRSESEVLSLCRSKRPARQSYGNSDPWYDGRGHEYTIVDTPEGGSVLTANEILLAIMRRYSPLWREHLIVDSIVITAFDAQTETSQQLNQSWLHRYLPSWTGGDGRSIETPNALQAPVCLAEAISSLAAFNTQKQQIAVYLPVTPSSPQTLPQEDHFLHVMIALYLMAHRHSSINSTPPSLNAVRRWAKRFVATPSPGLWWTVAPELGVLMLDYMPGHASLQTFNRVSERYFAMVRQLIWTDSLSSVVRQAKRYEAIVDFIARYAAQ